MKTNRFNPTWTIAIPIVSLVILGVYHLIPSFPFIVTLLCVGLIGSVVTAVHHAEVIAHKVGEPFGTLVLALSVTIIEVALIVSMMMSGGPEAMGLARDTIFAAVMIILNAIIGLSLLLGATKHQVQGFNLEGVTAALGTMTVIIVIAMVLPNYVTNSPAIGSYNNSQLFFIAIITLILFSAFTFFQTVRHRDYFLPVEVDQNAVEEDVFIPSIHTVMISLIMLIVSLIAVVLSAKGISPTLESLLTQFGAPLATLGIIIAAIVLLPEFGASIRAAKANRLQSSLNLAIGSAIASIGLTIPVVAFFSIGMGWTLELGLDAKSLALLVLSLFVVSNSLRTGYTTILPGIVHLCIFATYLFFSFVP
ncbi:calcium:proton antiporter [Acinetobacter sp. YH12239]|uniref:calcium:proton antiporter n=1 Tax=Acinetobacter sp. YH12239 TaxID=2601166 RepID=UPI0015D39CE6|nr:ionic transporter y4hA [Acinetobacter sp. YH12239]